MILLKPTSSMEDFLNGLIKKFNQISDTGKYDKKKTINEFIRPLFLGLGWELESKNSSVIDISTISKGRADYSFEIDGITKFVLKIAPLDENIDDKKWIIPVTTFAFNKGITWAIVTNFKKIKVLNSEVKGKTPLQMQFFEIVFDEFISKYDRLAYLLKKSFELDIIDKEAEFFSKKQKKTPIDKQLLEDLLKYSNKLSCDIQKSNSKKFSMEEIDESVHKILNRLIFIRACGDRGLEQKHLISNLREWEETKDEKLVKYLRKIFDYFEENYGGTIFSDHLCDKLEISDSILQEIIEGLYISEDKSIQYDFSIIESDVLGQCYEQYLRFFRTIENNSNIETERKKQGIFYTPSFIVDYIVKNTLGELVKDKKIDHTKIRVLDPACGSGSFLIKAYDFLYDHYIKKDKNFHQTQLSTEIEGGVYSKKVKILKENLFGVDLDKIATEIIQLNLLLKITEKKHHLPILQQNIRRGNSVVDDKKVDPLGFKWKDEFHHIFEHGGFDAIIGNPPYISNWTLSQNSRDVVEFLTAEYGDITMGHWDLYIIFIRKCLSLLKECGFFSFIVPSSFCTEKYGKKLRELIIKEYLLNTLVVFGEENVFEGVARQYCIFTIQNKKKPNNITNVIECKNKKFVKIHEIKQKEFLKFHNCTFRTDISIEDTKLKEKLMDKSEELGMFCCINVGVVAHSNERAPKKFQKDDVIFTKPQKSFKKYVEGKEISRNRIEWKGKYLDYVNNKEYFHRPKFPELFERKKIIVRRISGENNRIISVFDDNGFFSNDNLIHLILWNDEISKLQNPKTDQIYKNQDEEFIYYLSGIIGSKLISYYFMKFIATDTLQGTFTGIYPEDLRKIPIKNTSKKNKEEMIELVKKITMLNEQYLIEKQESKIKKIEEDIEKTDQKIDNLVYEIYEIRKDIKLI